MNEEFVGGSNLRYLQINWLSLRNETLQFCHTHGTNKSGSGIETPTIIGGVA